MHLKCVSEDGRCTKVRLMRLHFTATRQIDIHFASVHETFHLLTNPLPRI